MTMQEIFKRNINDEIFLISKMSNDEEAPFFVGSFKFLNLQNAIYYAFVDHNFDKSRNEFYKAGMVNALRHEKLSGEIFNVLDTFSYPLLSDSSSLISRYLSYERTEYPDSFSTYFGKAIQSVLKDDSQALQANIEGLKKWSKKGWAKQYAGIVTTFEGFFKNDKSVIEKGLKEIIAIHDKQEQPAIVKDYINLEAAALAKLAWRKGIEVVVNSELVPAELLPIKELSTYEGYEFFKEIQNSL